MRPNAERDPYASRVGGAARIIERPDPVVYGDARRTGRWSFDKEQLRFYETNGYLILPNHMPDAVAPLLREKERLARELRNREELILEPDGDEVRSIFSPHRFSSIADRYSRDPRILDVVTQLLGGDVYIHHARINVKPPLNGRSFPWHSDFETWHVEDGLPKPRVLTAWIFLTENNPFNGPLYLIPGSHKRYYSFPGRTPDRHYQNSLRKQEYGSPDAGRLREMVIESGGLAQAVGPPGTVVFHESNTMHGSPDNLSPWPRANIFFVYNSVENKPVAPFGGARPRPAFLRSLDFSALHPRKGMGE